MSGKNGQNNGAENGGTFQLPDDIEAHIVGAYMEDEGRVIERQNTITKLLEGFYSIDKRISLKKWKELVGSFRERIRDIYFDSEFSKKCEGILIPLLSDEDLNKLIDEMYEIWERRENEEVEESQEDDKDEDEEEENIKSSNEIEEDIRALEKLLKCKNRPLLINLDVEEGDDETQIRDRLRETIHEVNLIVRRVLELIENGSDTTSEEEMDEVFSFTEPFDPSAPKSSSISSTTLTRDQLKIILRAKSDCIEPAERLYEIYKDIHSRQLDKEEMDRMTELFQEALKKLMDLYDSNEPRFSKMPDLIGKIINCCHKLGRITRDYDYFKKAIYFLGKQFEIEGEDENVILSLAAIMFQSLKRWKDGFQLAERVLTGVEEPTKYDIEILGVATLCGMKSGEEDRASIRANQLSALQSGNLLALGVLAEYEFNRGNYIKSLKIAFSIYDKPESFRRIGSRKIALLYIVKSSYNLKKESKDILPYAEELLKITPDDEEIKRIALECMVNLNGDAAKIFEYSQLLLINKPEDSFLLKSALQASVDLDLRDEIAQYLKRLFEVSESELDILKQVFESSIEKERWELVDVCIGLLFGIRGLGFKQMFDYVADKIKDTQNIDLIYKALGFAMDANIPEKVFMFYSKLLHLVGENEEVLEIVYKYAINNDPTNVEYYRQRYMNAVATSIPLEGFDGKKQKGGSVVDNRRAKFRRN